MSNRVEIKLPPSGLTQDELQKFPAFYKWIKTLTHSLAMQYTENDHKFANDKYKLTAIEVQSTVWFTKTKLGFLKIQATVKNKGGEIPGAVFLRGGSVAMLMILQPEDVPAEPATEEEKYVILTVQPRVAAGSLAFTEIPAGMIDGGTFKGSAAKEISEETGIKVTENELFDMSKEAAPEDTIFDWKVGGKQRTGAKEPLDIAMYPSPGACDEMMPLYLYQKRLPRDLIEALKGLETGSKTENEKITLKLVPLNKLWRECSQDGKTLGALALYEGLKKEGNIIPQMEGLSKEELDAMRETLDSKKE
ncbi:NUDIX domain-containing protein [Pleomassaria siparia CBS 279.74]|uniref:NUDIX domain-containing protein n=1 Tax=Pleomassaria siparia CBS 279.74 TaxID=1314801 RepID=A0A6G1KQT0_9PLEO|nr:NUDIX domain-containing protein [Pleomassaria siparia CBS 279.74]